MPEAARAGASSCGGAAAIADRVDEVRAACENALADPALTEVAEALGRAGVQVPALTDAVRLITEAPAGQDAVLGVKAELKRRGFDTPLVLERLLLVRSAVRSLPQVHRLPVTATVMGHILQAFKDFAHPPASLIPAFESGHYPFVALSKIATLRRFPAGQYDWEVTGLPRSFTWRVKRLDLPKLLLRIAFDLRGFRPLFMPHFSIFRRNWLVLREVEVNRSYFQMAMALRRQPEIKGMVASAWFYSPDAYAVSPHLSWLRREIVENGGFASTLGLAPEDGGYLRQGTRGKKLFETREHRPTEGLVVWPRSAMLRWADEHPEYDS